MVQLKKKTHILQIYFGRQLTDEVVEYRAENQINILVRVVYPFPVQPQELETRTNTYRVIYRLPHVRHVFQTDISIKRIF